MPTASDETRHRFTFASSVFGRPRRNLLAAFAACGLLTGTSAHAVAQNGTPSDARNGVESAPQADPSGEEASPPSSLAEQPWVRVVEDDARIVKLQIAIRRFEPVEGDGPSLTIAGAVHVADRPYYDALQEMLDGKDLVLFEGVRPAGAEDTEPRTPAERVERTKDRLRLLGTFFAQARDYAEQNDLAPPTTVDGLKNFLNENELHRALTWLSYATHDGWGNELIVEQTPAQDGNDNNRDANSNGPSLDILSLGSDGEPGGSGRAADLRLSDQRRLSSLETGKEQGIQARLADVLRLTFQLDAMDESGPNWRNADMSVAQVRERIAALGGNPDVLFSQLEGGGFSGTLINMLLGFIDMMPGMAPRVKLMMIDMLENADQVLASGAGPLGEEILTVIIEERNQVIMDALIPVVESEAAEEGWDDIAILYGAGHMKDLVERLRDQIGYEPVEGEWITAISLDLNRFGISPLERRMVKTQIARQLRMLEAQNEAENRTRNPGDR